MNVSMCLLAVHLLSISTLPTNESGTSAKLLRVAESRFADVNQPARNKSDDSSRFFSSFGPENALTVTIELRGDAVPHATHYGKVVLEGKDSKGEAIVLHESYAAGLTDLRTEMTQIDRNMMYLGRNDVPEDVIQVELKCALPARDATALRDMRGKIKLRSGKPEDVPVSNLADSRGKKIEHPTLARAGLEILVVASKGGSMMASGDPSRNLTLMVSGESEAMMDLDLVDAQGEALHNSTMWSTIGSSTQYTLMCEKPLPDDASLKVTVLTQSRTIDVPFHFTNIPLP